MRIVQVSDTHLSHRGGITNRNYERLITFINEDLHPDLVVHSGDMVILDPDSAADRATALGLSAMITAPLRAVPGNHDVGEPGDRPWGGLNATSARVAAFTGAYGPDHWVEIVGGYAVIGLNSEILATGLPEEQAQWDWLGSISGPVGTRPALVFCHKPFWSPVPGPSDGTLSIPDAQRDRLLEALAGVDVKVYANGHLHRFAIGRQGRALTVTAPSTAFAARSHDDLAGHGLQQVGVVEYQCEGGGVEVFFRSVPGLTEGSPFDVEQFVTTAAELGVTLGD
jgi:3',5'-cyclic AMP phosphodiesterase CpdA